ncbi:vacuolar protein-sorting-associated protein 25, putative [Bodo saltans]|uniref:Vacuolar protein-sorting-associated protein 25, putative n=1 Tax=Bodo saltans TaxID=75058 RepID=A0A0S4JPF6_BODSA|nr:vacuolar protein-sorting-associated protein 25, putative [Bodo saltans]|eukprot:CUG91231.1 vacuolar protein-sorting-associated protein 25, putative [Bodo saltans]
MSSSSSAAVASDEEQQQVPHWIMYQLPPFFTLQPVPATLQRQLTMWASVVFEHAAFHATRAKPPVESSMMRLYTTSSGLFTSSKLHRELPHDAIQQLFEFMAEKFSNRCALQSSPESVGISLLVACVQGGLGALESELYRWVLEESASATTATDLAKTGAVLTFDELVEGRCLLTSSSNTNHSLLVDSKEIHRAASHMPAELREQSSGAASEEVVLRAFLHHLWDRGPGDNATLSSFRIRLFNLDGSSEPPYDGVKIGG